VHFTQSRIFDLIFSFILNMQVDI